MEKEQVKKIRVKMLMTQPEFAKALGVSTPTISDWETGKKQLRFSNIRKILELCKKNNIEVE